MKSIAGQQLHLPDSEIFYYRDFLDVAIADAYFKHLKKYVPWQQEDIKVFGKVYPQPRLTALYGNNGKPYSYSSITMYPQIFDDLLKELKEAVEEVSGVHFTSCLLNLYRDGRDSNGWHADNEKELGRNPVIASVSLGATRFFHLKHREDKNIRYKLPLEHGSLLLMRGATQHHYLHQVAKTKKTVGNRINLTFRVIK